MLGCFGLGDCMWNLASCSLRPLPRSPRCLPARAHRRSPIPGQCYRSLSLYGSTRCSELLKRTSQQGSQGQVSGCLYHRCCKCPFLCKLASSRSGHPMLLRSTSSYVASSVQGKPVSLLPPWQQEQDFQSGCLLTTTNYAEGA